MLLGEARPAHSIPLPAAASLPLVVGSTGSGADTERPSRPGSGSGETLVAKVSSRLCSPLQLQAALNDVMQMGGTSWAVMEPARD